MKEFLKSQEQEALLSEREALEGLGKDGLVDLIEAKGREVSEIERLMDIAAGVLDGYGTSVEIELNKRETKNGNKT